MSAERNPASFCTGILAYASSSSSAALSSDGSPFRDDGKHLLAASIAFGSPVEMTQRIRSLRPRRLNSLISSLTHFDWAACGEQTTIRFREAFSASRSLPPKSDDPGNSSLSRKMGNNQRGTVPSSVGRPTSRFGSLYDSSTRCSQVTFASSAWL